MQIAYLTPPDQREHTQDYDDASIYFVVRKLDKEHTQIVCANIRGILDKAIVHSHDAVVQSFDIMLKQALDRPEPLPGTGALSKKDLEEVLSKTKKGEKEN